MCICAAFVGGSMYGRYRAREAPASGDLDKTLNLLHAKGFSNLTMTLERNDELFELSKLTPTNFHVSRFLKESPSLTPPP